MVGPTLQYDRTRSLTSHNTNVTPGTEGPNDDLAV
jgi:hypothetical protein